MIWLVLVCVTVIAASTDDGGIAKILQDHQRAIERLESKLNELRATDYVRRSCHEIKLFNPLLPSGMYWIDPDGQDYGEPPIYAHCNMKSGRTTIQHDSEAPTTVQHCSKPGCYVRSVGYSVPLGQLSALMDLSEQCQQTLQYECQNAAWVLKGVAQSWWEDRQRVPRYFCHPSKSNAGMRDGDESGESTADSLAPSFCSPCLCDASSRSKETCVIKEKSLLPVTTLKFGGQGDSWSGRYSLGRIECTGRHLDLMPSSCNDLKVLGHGLNGFYSVKAKDGQQMASVYCDMAKSPTDPDQERWMGYTGLKTIPVYFYVLRQSAYNIRNSPIPFDVERLNLGGGMSIETGLFTAPASGVYFFTFAGLRHPSAQSAKVALRLIINSDDNNKDDLIAWSQEAPNNNSGRSKNGYAALALQSTLRLSSGDQVALFLLAGTLADSELEHYTHFSGMLLHEM